MSDKVRIAFFGTPQFAVPTLERLIASPHDVVVVVTQPDRPRGRGQRVVEGPVKAAAARQGITVAQPDRLKTQEWLDTFSLFQTDLAVVAAYGKILPEALLAIPRYGFVNVHASLLPRWRGAAPVERAVMAGDRETGVTIMRVVAALDAGPMMASAVRPIADDETADTVESDLSTIGADLLLKVIDQIGRGTAVEVPQDEGLATYAPRLTKEEGLIDWRQPAAAIHNRVRGLHPWPHAYTFLDGSRYIIHRTRVVDSLHGAATTGIPGTVLVADGDDFSVATGEGVVAIETIQAEGKRPVSAREFLAGHRVAPGMKMQNEAR